MYKSKYFSKIKQKFVLKLLYFRKTYLREVDLCDSSYITMRIVISAAPVSRSIMLMLNPRAKSSKQIAFSPYCGTKNRSENNSCHLNNNKVRKCNRRLL